MDPTSAAAAGSSPSEEIQYRELAALAKELRAAHVERVAAALAAIEPRVPHLTFRAADPDPDVTVEGDGHVVAPPVDVPIDPGPHVVSVRRSRGAPRDPGRRGGAEA